MHHAVISAVAHGFRGRTLLMAIVLSTGCLFGCEPGSQPGARPQGVEMDAQQETVLRTSNVPDDLLATAERYAGSDNPADHQTLRQVLGTNAFLNRLDTAEDYTEPPRSLRLARVMHVLMENPSPEAAKTLVELTRATEFTARLPRQYLLIRALIEVRPSPPDAIAFWRTHGEPRAVHRHNTVVALVKNRSRPALALLEDLFADSTHDPDERVMWMRESILVFRHELSVLEMCDRLLRGRLQADLRDDLVEALFDYQPDAWYLECEPPTPPSIASYTKEARLLLRRIGEYALERIALSERQKAVVEGSLKALPE